ncbi:hypothetical protein FD755_023583 [Muntiacus reevesi]|uniref:Ig-like domain-containing protein n=1 Tax=Muntiacus reevesi TaxID=9886 RepID=A0A5N3VWG7_MUNRE|nr:hypothetical protein FD755_023583 [Muntiacus reevesi]
MDKFLSLLILWLQLNWVSSKQDVSQSPEALSVREGDRVDLNCSYRDSALYFLQWFRQDPGKGLTSLLSIQANQKGQTSGRITVSLDKPSRDSASHIATSQHSDSTTDLCALSHKGSPRIQGSIFLLQWIFPTQELNQGLLCLLSNLSSSSVDNISLSLVIFFVQESINFCVLALVCRSLDFNVLIF